MAARQHPRYWDCPVVHYEQETGLILSPGADDTRADLPGAYSIARPIISIEGCWSNCDVFVSVPETWVTNAVRLELWSIGPAGKALLQVAFCNLAGLQLSMGPDVFASGIILSARGAPNDGFEVRAATTTLVSGGQVQLRLWGDQSSPDYIGNTPANRLPDFRMPSRAAHLMAVEPVDEENDGLVWAPLHVDNTGALIVTGGGGGGSVIVSGAATPSDTFANPNNAVTTWSLFGGYTRATNQWGRIDRVPLAGQTGIPDLDLPASIAASSFLWGYDGFGINPAGSYRLACFALDGNMAVLQVGGLGTYQYGAGANSTVTLPGIGEPFFEVQTFPQIRVQETQVFRPAVGGYVDLVPTTGTGAVPNNIPIYIYDGNIPSPGSGEGVAARCSIAGGLHVTQLPTSPADAQELPSRSNGFGIASLLPGGGTVAAILFSLTASNESGARVFLQLHNKASAVSPGDVPIWEAPVAASGGFVVSGEEAFTVQGLSFINGLRLMWSTTSGTFTAPGAATGLNIHARYAL